MPAGPKRERSREKTQLAEETVTDHVRGQVLRALGEPDDRYEIRVRRLWEDHYRANVFLGEGLACGRIAYSYFLVADGDGNIVESSPALHKRY
jgi:hypothetical protein